VRCEVHMCGLVSLTMHTHTDDPDTSQFFLPVRRLDLRGVEEDSTVAVALGHDRGVRSISQASSARDSLRSAARTGSQSYKAGNKQCEGCWLWNTRNVVEGDASARVRAAALVQTVRRRAGKTHLRVLAR
jgi:hypothetical protein